MTVVGVDVSSRAIHLSWIDQGRPMRWHQELPNGHLIDRLRAIQINWPMWFDEQAQLWDEATDIAIEMPFGRSRASVAALMATTGVITHQAPPWARVAWPSAGELRAAIGAANTKSSARYAVGELYPDAMWGFDEHECDALVACLGWTAILAAQEAA